MNFDPKMMIGLLFQTHQQFTMTNPISQHPIKNLDKINENKTKIIEIISSLKTKENFENFSNKCLIDLNKLNLAYGTAHYGYQFWVSVALTAIYNGELAIANGCCAVEHCSINQLYDIVSDNLLSSI